MPRNVVIVVRRRSLLRRDARRARQDLALAQLGDRYRGRPRPDGDGLEIDFPKHLERRAARDRVVGDLAEIEPDWRRLFFVYPAERNLRDGA